MEQRCQRLLELWFLGDHITKQPIHLAALRHEYGDRNRIYFYTLFFDGFAMLPAPAVANAERLIKKYGCEARLQCAVVPETVHPHLFRLSYGAQLYHMGFSLPIIAKLLDHESLNTTERYAETDIDMINQAFKRMTF